MAIRGFSGGGSQGGGRTRGFGGPSGPRRGGEPGDPGGPGGHGPRGPERRGYFSGVRLFHGPMRFMFFGRPIIISSGRQIGFMCGFVAFLVMLISTFVVFGNLSMYKQDKAEWQQTISEYQEYSSSYLDIIQKANDGESGYGKVTGTYDRSSFFGSVSDYKTGFVVYNNYGSLSYSVVYEFTVDGDIYFDETMSLYYNTSNVPNPLTIAYQVVNENGEVKVYSVETDFVNTYADDMAYYNAQIEECNKSIKTSITSAIILIIIIVIIIALIVLSIVKVIKNSKKQQAMEEAKKQAEVKEAQARAQQAEDELNQSRRYCEYCGTKFPEGEDECPNCGSSHFIIKK